MGKYQLRTDRLRTEEAAAIYLLHLVLHVRSLKLYDVETRAIFSVPSPSRILVALIASDTPVLSRDS